jgi:hypothetical protein
MRIALCVAASILALSAAPAVAQEAMSAEADGSAVTATAQDEYTDAEIEGFVAAMARITPIARSLNGAAPSADQQAEMAAAISDSGLTIERFNGIGTAAASDAVLGARILVAQAPKPAAGSVAASVTDAEVEQYAAAMARLTPIARALNGAAPTPEQQAEMAGIVAGSGLALERFNAISGANAQDAWLRARVSLANARAGR